MKQDGRKSAGRRWRRAVRLRSETASGEALGELARELTKVVAVDLERAREILLGLGRPGPRPA